MSHQNLRNSSELVKGIDQGRAFEVVSNLRAQEIESKIIPYDLPGKVKVTVYEKQFDKAALALARSDLLQEDASHRRVARGCAGRGDQLETDECFRRERRQLNLHQLLCDRRV